MASLDKTRLADALFPKKIFPFSGIFCGRSGFYRIQAFESITAVNDKNYKIYRKDYGMRVSLVSGLVTLLLIDATNQASAAGNAAQGEVLYQSLCAACHSIDYNGVGPAHKGLFGRKAGSLPDYAYSPALAASGISWSEKALDSWLASPEKFIPGQKMGFSVTSAKQRADLIAYLKKASVAK